LLQALETLPECSERTHFGAESPGAFLTSVSELALGHPLLLSLCDLPMNPSVNSHSIIADLRDPPRPGATDGIVPYVSSHLEGAASELLVHGHHIWLQNPAIIREVRRILREHAGLGGGGRTDPGGERLRSDFPLGCGRLGWHRLLWMSAAKRPAPPLISTQEGRVAVRAVRTDEESIFARDAAEFRLGPRSIPTPPA
jgi:hypothetical protein